MKRIKKILALFIVFVMVVGLSGFSALAAEKRTTGSITIKDAFAWEEYEIYKLLDLSYDGNEAYAYSVTDEWSEFFEAVAVNYGFSVDNGYVTFESVSEDDSNMRLFSTAALNYAAENGISPVQDVKIITEEDGNYSIEFQPGFESSDNVRVVAGDGSCDLIFDELSLGYYLVSTSVGSLLEINTTNYDGVIEEKNAIPTVTKEVLENSTGEYGDECTAGIGDTVVYRETLQNIKGSIDLVLSDTMCDGLTFLGADTLSINLDGTELTQGVDYTVIDYTLPENAENNEYNFTFQIEFEDYLFDPDGVYAVTDDSYVEIYYDAMVNSNALLNGEININEVYINYGLLQTLSEKVEVNVINWSVNIYKYTEGEDGNDIPLAGAEFILSKEWTDENDPDSSPVTVYAITDEDGKIDPEQGNYGWTENKSDATVFVTPEDGLINISGLDAGTYTLEETEAPAGYNKLDKTINIVIDEDGNVSGTENITVTSDDGEETNLDVIKVMNNTGNALPGTGGIGTTVFYVVGAALILAVVVILVTRQRMKHTEKD